MTRKMMPWLACVLAALVLPPTTLAGCGAASRPGSLAAGSAAPAQQDRPLAPPAKEVGETKETAGAATSTARPGACGKPVACDWRDCETCPNNPANQPGR